MSVHLVLIIIAIVVILSFIVGIILKKKYQKGMVSFDTTIIPSIGKKRTVIPPCQSNVVLSFEQPVSSVQAPSYVEQVNASFGSASSENGQKTGILFDVPEEVLDFDQPVIIRSMDVD